MLKKLVQLSVFLFLFFNVWHNVFAYSVPEYVRIGLEYKYKLVDSVPIINKSINFGFGVGDTFNSEGIITSSNGFTMNTSNLYYVKVGQSFSSYQTCKTSADNLSSSTYKAIPASLGIKTWVVYLGGFSTIAEANSVKSQYGNNATVVSQSSSRIELRANNSAVIVFDSNNPQIFAADDTVVSLNDRKYRGRIEFNRYSGGKMTAINVLTVNEYLYSAVPSEIYPSWHKEALKAQAVAGRNYCITRFGVHKNINYDLCDATHCQAYKGANNETAATTVAVDETANILIYYNGTPINSVFFSSSGGYTEDSENVWVSAQPYLKAVPDTFETEYKTWYRNFTVAEMESILSKNNVKIGQVKDVLITEASPSGRVNELSIIGTNGVKILRKEEIRTFFSVYGGSLESRLFTINGNTTTPNYISVQSNTETVEINIADNYAISSTDTVKLGAENISAISNDTTSILNSQTGSSSNTSGNFYFSGRGYGHGVGMSQYGAKGMAEAGFDFIQILKHYYTGVDIL